MRREGERLRTFLRWPADAPVTSGDLARAGFFYSGTGDQVQCFCCGGILRYWLHGDSPIADHRRCFRRAASCWAGTWATCRSSCPPGLRGRPTGQPAPADDRGPSRRSPDTPSTPRWRQRKPGGPPSTTGRPAPRSSPTSSPEQGSSTQTEAAGQHRASNRSKGEGHGDNVKCYFCDGGLRNWEPGDDPWQEHAKWFPRVDHRLRFLEPSAQGMVRVWFVGANVVAGGLGGSSAMLSPVVQTVVRMGFRAGLVESLVQTKYLLSGQHYTSVSDLVADVLQAEEDERQREPQTREPEVGQGPSSATLRTQPPVKQKGQMSTSKEAFRTCKVCMDKPVSIVFIPCGHLVVCGDCAASLRHCPICRASVRGSVRAFMS
ncbi:hypothetical protein CRUP_018386 [Coryphaenoides rupestris]|nr:hypothetical protein CRUP_018386 [Coryphaenoides rupestris]